MTSETSKPFVHDPNFNGPIKKRHFTDIICFFLFFACGILWLVCAVFAFLNGHPQRLLHPTDSTGKECGIGEYQNLKYAYYFDIIQCARFGISLLKGCPTPQVCVASCPNITKVVNPFNNYDVSWMICKPGVLSSNNPPISSNAFSLVTKGQCAPYVIRSMPILGRCIPVIDENLVNVLIPQEGVLRNYTLQQFQTSAGNLAKYLQIYKYGQNIYEDLLQNWWIYIAGLVFAMILALIWITLMRWLAAFMVSLSFVMVACLLAFGAYFCFVMWYRIKNPDKPSISIIGVTPPDDVFAYVIRNPEKLAKFWFGTGLALASLFGLLLILTLCFITRLRIAVQLIREASKAINMIPGTLVWPLLPFVGQVLIFVLWAATAIYLASSGTPIYQTVNIPTEWETMHQRFTPYSYTASTINSGEWSFAHGYSETGINSQNSAAAEIIYVKNHTVCDYQVFMKQLQVMGIDPNKTLAACQFMAYENHPWYPYMQIFNLFAAFWCLFFTNALNQITLAGAFSSYYWARRKPKDIPFCATWKSFLTAVTYHSGSLAFGSLLLAITKLIRVLVEYVKDNYIDRVPSRGVAPLQCCVNCCRCCLWVWDRFLQFLSKRAFIMIAIHGKNFLQSAADAFALIVRNAIRVIVLTKTNDFLLFMGQLVIMSVTGYFFYFLYYMNNPLTPYLPKIRTIEFSIAVQVIGAYFVARIFFGIYEMAVDTLFLCFLEDGERNDGSQARPYFMSKELRRILHKENKI